MIDARVFGVGSEPESAGERPPPGFPPAPKKAGYPELRSAGRMLVGWGQTLIFFALLLAVVGALLLAGLATGGSGHLKLFVAVPALLLTMGSMVVTGVLFLAGGRACDALADIATHTAQLAAAQGAAAEGAAGADGPAAA